MKKMLTALALALTAVVSMGQTTTDAKGVTTSTDPAKAASVERKAAELKAQDQKVATSGTSASTHKTTAHRAKHQRHHKNTATKAATSK